MANLALTPEPPYYAVIFTSIRTEGDHGYSETAQAMVELASQQPGFLGMESVRQELGITVSYWQNEEAILAWKNHVDHRVAMLRAQDWYRHFRVRVAKVEREYGY